MPEVRPERSEWRDLELSKRHKKWGWDCPAVDIDFLMIEYDRCLPIAIIEYKCGKQESQGNNASYKAIEELAKPRRLPFFVVIYSADLTQYNVIPKNFFAKEHVKEVNRVMTELEYVEFLYRIRKRSLPEEVSEKIKSHSLP